MSEDPEISPKPRILLGKGDLLFPDVIVKIAVSLLLLLSLFTALKFRSFDWYAELMRRNTYTTILGAVWGLYTLAFLAWYLVRTGLWWRYRPWPLPDTPWPRVTVIVPAYNEGALMEKAIYSLADADYPADKLEIICIDDGSQDDTWNYIQKAVRKYPNVVQAIRFPKNQGKREALCAGFRQGRGDYFITVDSDSIIEPDALKAILAPMLQDHNIGGVTGSVRVYNRYQNLLTRMLWVRYILVHDFIRAVQSMYRFVVYMNGVLSAYRREAIIPILEEWRHQTFMGMSCLVGEDRALTNLLLRQGYDTVFQGSAKIYTMAPETYRGLASMFLRWERGNLPEALVQLSYMFTRYRPRHRLLPVVDFFMRELEAPLSCIYLPLLIVICAWYPIVILEFLSAMALVSLLRSLYYLREEHDADFLYGVVYCFYFVFLLRWVKPYALLTLRKGRDWITR